MEETPTRISNIVAKVKGFTRGWPFKRRKRPTFIRPIRTTCPRCGAPVPPGMPVCPTCGARIPVPRRTVRCRYCGYKAPAYLQVCPSCGRTLRPRPAWWNWPLYVVLLLIIGGIGLSMNWRPHLSPARLWEGIRVQAHQLLPETTPVALVIIPTPTPTYTYTPTYTPSPTFTFTPTPTRTPTPTVTPTPTPMPPALKYKVQPGDTPEEIAKRFGIPVQDLLDANGLTADSIIRVGQELIIPLPTPTPTPTPTPSE